MRLAILNIKKIKQSNMKSFISIWAMLICFTTLIHGQKLNEPVPKKEISHTFYSTGNLATQENNNNNEVLKAIAAKMEKNENSTLLLLGNNAGINGFKTDDDKGKANIDSYINIIKPFSERIVFIPGRDDWSGGLKDLEKQEEYLEKAFDNKEIFQPEKSCAIEKLEINDDIDLLVINSQWALSNWDKIPNINDHCEIKNHFDFYVEIGHEIVKSQGKTVLVAMYHPIATYGKYGNSYGFGINPQSVNHQNYKDLSDRLFNIAQQSKNVVFISGHEQNMQLIIDKKIPVIISGAAGKIRNAKKGRKSVCTFNENGFSEIIEFKDGSMWSIFYGASNNYSDPIFSKEIIAPEEAIDMPDYNEKSTPQYVSKSIYQPEELKRTGFYKFLWGQHFREDYLTPITLKTALLDTLYGGMTVTRKGGGHQTNSLRLEDKDGREYVMRSAKKSALRFIQYFVFKTQYLPPEIEDTYFIQLLQDFWTTANPYASLTVGDLADAVDIYHANPELYYIPKQKALGIYNEDYGDKIFFIEERVSDGHENVASFGGTEEIISSADLFEALREEKEKIEVDEALYIRSRLFDNILGDWDRHEDQWRWGVHEGKDGKTLYRPIPRDRDQVYSDFDGFMLKTFTVLSPPLRFMQRYDDSYNHTRWFNDAGDDLDLAVLQRHTQEDWLREARYLKENLTEEVVEKAFANFPKEIDQKKVARTKKGLLGRIANVEENAVNLYRFLRTRFTIQGTDKDDHFVITRKPAGITNVTIYRIKDGKKGDKFWDVDYDKEETKEIWIYGLDDEDIFEVNGEGDNLIRIEIIGGQNNDTYRINNKKRIRVIDQKSKPNTFENPVNKILSDNYDLNTYDFEKTRRDLSNTLPTFAINPDDGFRVGLTYNYTKNALRRNPFTAKHSISGLYITETSGVQVNYKGEFANFFENANLGIEGGYNSASFTDNFFGFGNETVNRQDELGLEYNRVRLQKLLFSPSLIFRGFYGSQVEFALLYERIQAENTPGRFIETLASDDRVFNGQNFIGLEASYEYENFDSPGFPRSGIGFNFTAGYKNNFDESRGFGYLIPQLRLTSKIDRRGIIVFATKLKAHFNLGNNFEFYQAATIGDSDGLRGLRRERFSGKTAYYQNSDLRISLGRVRNGLLPIIWGIYGAYDYGRVWVENDDSDTWYSTPGGGVFFYVGGFTTVNFGYFSSDEGSRINVLMFLAF